MHPTLAPVRAWAGTTPTGSPARRCRTPSSDWPRRRASHNKSWEPAATRGDSALALRAPRPPDKFGWPDGHLSPKAVLTITVGHLVPVTHRPCPCGAHGPPAPGHDSPANPALSGQHCGPFSVRRRRGPGPLEDQPGATLTGILRGRLVRVSGAGRKPCGWPRVPGGESHPARPGSESGKRAPGPDAPEPCTAEVRAWARPPVLPSRPRQVLGRVARRTAAWGCPAEWSP